VIENEPLLYLGPTTMIRLGIESGMIIVKENGDLWWIEGARVVENKPIVLEHLVERMLNARN
jgi:hypothetical protein